jgi:hypothetical protein
MALPVNQATHTDEEEAMTDKIAERRERIATAAMQALIADPKWVGHMPRNAQWPELQIAKTAVRFARFLIAEIDREQESATSVEQLTRDLNEARAKLSRLSSILCDPEGNPCFPGSDHDLKVAREALEVKP